MKNLEITKLASEFFVRTKFAADLQAQINATKAQIANSAKVFIEDSLDKILAELYKSAMDATVRLLEVYLEANFPPSPDKLSYDSNKFQVKLTAYIAKQPSQVITNTISRLGIDQSVKAAAYDLASNNFPDMKPAIIMPKILVFSCNIR